MSILRKLAATVAVIGFLTACSPGSTTSPTTETPGDYNPQTSAGDYNPQTSEIETAVSPSTVQVKEKSAQALAYEQNIGNNLADETCTTMLNIRTWLEEEERDKAIAQLNKVISVAGIYKESAATYIADPQALRNFKDAMSKTATIGEGVIVALTAMDLAGLLYIADLLEVMQTADADVRRHFGSPLSPPCA